MAKREKLPFTVKASGFQVKVIGAEFNISVYNNELNASVYLKEGIIEISYFMEGKKIQKMRMISGGQVNKTIREIGQGTCFKCH